MHPNTSDADAHATFQQAIALHQQGQLEQAQVLYECVLSIQTDNADAWHLSGVIALQKQDFPTAAVRIGEAIKLNASQAVYYVNQGIALKELGQLAAAVSCYDKAIALQPNYAAAYYSRGNALKDLQQLNAAVESFDQAIALQPNDLLAHLNRGLALHALQKYDAAAASFDCVIALQPEHAQAHYHRGIAMHESDRLLEAIASYDQAIALNPANASALYNRGIALTALQQSDAALASYNQAIAVAPNYAEPHYNRGNLLQEKQQFEAAIASYENATSIKPDYVQAHYNRGIAQQACNRLDAAVASWDQAIAIQPDLVEAHWNKSLALLLGGHFDQGWALYEWRWKREEQITSNRNFHQPMWTGVEPLEGQSILLYHEQGFGDTLQFCRYVQQVAEKGARVIVEVPRPLINVLKGLGGVSEWVAIGEPRPAFNYHCSIVSLPVVFQTTLATIPCANAYLRADERQIAKWTQILDAKTRPRVGIVWSGNPKHKNDHNRSIPLAMLLRAIPDCVEVVSLQKELRSEDASVLRGFPLVRHFGEELHDFSDTAALSSMMDVVVSVDTSVAHLSAALGQLTWVLLPYSPDWRWLLDRTDSPWYASVALYRQQAVGDWTQPLDKLRTDLIKLTLPN